MQLFEISLIGAIVISFVIQLQLHNLEVFGQNSTLYTECIIDINRQCYVREFHSRKMLVPTYRYLKKGESFKEEKGNQCIRCDLNQL